MNSHCCALVITFNGEKWIKNCLDSLLSGSLIPDVLVIDNASSDKTREIVRQFSKVELIKNEENLGFGKANNIGLKLAYQRGYQHFFLLNQDAFVLKDTLKVLVEQLDKENKYGILSPVHFANEHSEIDPDFEKYLRKGSKQGYHAIRNKEKTGVIKVPFVNAAAWMISRGCLERVGLFHPAFFHYGEDLNFVHRLLHQGLKIGVVANTGIVHQRASPDSPFLKDAFVIIERRFLNVLLDPQIFRWLKPFYLLDKFFWALRDLSNWGQLIPFTKHSIKTYWKLKKRIAGFSKSDLQIK